jgi:hypothetical protein
MSDGGKTPSKKNGRKYNRRKLDKLIMAYVSLLLALRYF